MRIPKVEVARRREAVLSFFRKNPTISVAKLNAALRSGEVTGKPEKMLNIKTGYELRKEAVASPELPGVVIPAPCPDPACEVVGQHETKELAPGVVANVHETEAYKSYEQKSKEADIDEATASLKAAADRLLRDLPETTDELAKAIEVK